jgi:hypothetical protein
MQRRAQSNIEPLTTTRNAADVLWLIEVFKAARRTSDDPHESARARNEAWDAAEQARDALTIHVTLGNA